jgi:hypothetical protein
MAAYTKENAELNPFAGKFGDVTIENISFEKFVELMSADSLIDGYLLMIEAFRYNGFDPKGFFKLLLNKAKAKGRSRDQFLKDIFDLLGYYMSRGTTINARGVKDTFHEEMKARITELISLYDIKDNIPVNGGKADVVTLGRLQATFPAILGIVYASGRAKPIGTGGIIEPALMFPGGAALIPTKGNYDPLLKSFVDWSVTFTKIISRRNKATGTKTDKEIQEEQMGWAMIARGSSATTDDEREKFLNKYAHRHYIAP